MMALFSPRDSEKVQATELKLNREGRRKYIRKETIELVKLARANIRNRHKNGRALDAQPIPVPHWKDDGSIVWIMYYAHLQVKDQEAAISSDIGYFSEVVDALRNKYPELSLRIDTSLITGRKVPIPIQILVEENEDSPATPWQ